MFKLFKYRILFFVIVLILSNLACSISRITPTPTEYFTEIPQIEETITPIVENLELNSEISYAIVVDCKYLNFRKESNEKSEIVDTIPAGSQVRLLNNFNSPQNGWYYVEWNGRNGWVNGEYLFIKK